MTVSRLEVERRGKLCETFDKKKKHSKRGQDEGAIESHSFFYCFNVRTLNMLKVIEKDPVKRGKVT